MNAGEFCAASGSGQAVATRLIPVRLRGHPSLFWEEAIRLAVPGGSVDPGWPYNSASAFAVLEVFRITDAQSPKTFVYAVGSAGGLVCCRHDGWGG